MKIEEIASVHLGKAGDGSIVKLYVTPDEVDPSLLVAVPRVYNRTQYGIDESNLPFKGKDTWNCYEFSTLMNNGFPVSGLLRIVYHADSTNIVESKSLKLYLNSYNMFRCGDTVEEVQRFVESSIEGHLATLLNDHWIDVSLNFEDSVLAKPIDGDFVSIEKLVDVKNLTFEHFNESPEILVKKAQTYPVRYRSSVLRSNCRVTNQPDWGDVYVYINGEHIVTPESLLQYIVSMRCENHFHEEICECIYKRLYDLLQPEELYVACLYTRRGGIDINPVRATSDELIYDISPGLVDAYFNNIKTMRQ